VLGSAFLAITAIAVGLFAAYNLFHYILYLLVIHPKDASNIGHTLNEFERRQLVDWTPKLDDFLKHDDENRTYDDVFGPYRSECDNYSTCVFPRAIFTHPYESDYALLKPVQQGMRILDLGCGSGAAAYYLASQFNVEIVCVTNSAVQADICRRKFEKFNGRVQVVLSDFDHLELADEHFDAIYAFESIGYTKDLDAWLARCWRSLKPGGRLLIRSPGSLDACRREHDYLSVTAFFENWRGRRKPHACISKCWASTHELRSKGRGEKSRRLLISDGNAEKAFPGDSRSAVVEQIASTRFGPSKSAGAGGHRSGL
jgi:SAM-dependent methyltransferase